MALGLMLRGCHAAQGNPAFPAVTPGTLAARTVLTAAGIGPHSPPPAQPTSPTTPTAGPQCSAAPRGAGKISKYIQVTKNFKRTQ